MEIVARGERWKVRWRAHAGQQRTHRRMHSSARRGGGLILMGPRIEIEIEGVDKLDREIRNWNERLHKELQKVVKRMEGAIEREVKANIAVDSGALGASVYGFSSVRTGKGAIKAKFRGSWTCEIRATPSWRRLARGSAWTNMWIKPTLGAASSTMRTGWRLRRCSQAISGVIKTLGRACSKAASRALGQHPHVQTLARLGRQSGAQGRKRLEAHPSGRLMAWLPHPEIDRSIRTRLMAVKAVSDLIGARIYSTAPKDKDNDRLYPFVLMSEASVRQTTRMGRRRGCQASGRSKSIPGPRIKAATSAQASKTRSSMRCISSKRNCPSRTERYGMCAG